MPRLELALLLTLACAPSSPPAMPAPSPAPEPVDAPAPAPTPAPSLPESPTEGMIRILGGSLVDDRAVRHAIADFDLDQVEVTAGHYHRCVEAGGCPTPSKADGDCNYLHRSAHDDQPMNCVSWHEATSYCAWIGKRLPSEWEWEWAAQGRDQDRYFPWGSAEPKDQVCFARSLCKRDDLSCTYTCSVGSMPAGDSLDGVHDLAGNVWEWTSSLDGDVSFARGGSWADQEPDTLAAGFRIPVDLNRQSWKLGFRCAR